MIGLSILTFLSYKLENKLNNLLISIDKEVVH